MFVKGNNKDWWGTILKGDGCLYEPNTHINTSSDDGMRKAGILVVGNIYSLLNKFKVIEDQDLITDDIEGVGFISVADCKDIIDQIK